MQPRSRSSSTNSNTSATSTSPAETIQIFVKLSGGHTLPLTLPTSTPVSTLITDLSSDHCVPEDSLRLLFSGQHLTHLPRSTPLSAIPHLQQNSTIHLLSPLRGGTSDYNIAEQSEKPQGPENLKNLTAMTAMIDQQLSSTDASTPDPSASSTPDPSSTPSTTVNTPSKPRPISRKPRCTFKTCKALAQPIVGDCGFCGNKFCGKHRMLESHDCKGLEDAKSLERQRNRDKLEGERTQVIRGV